MGATITVRRCRLSSSGETTRHGRVFRISLPRVGSSRTNWTSPRKIERATATASLYRQSAWPWARPATGRHRVRASPWRPPPTPLSAREPHEQPNGRALLEVRRPRATGRGRAAPWAPEYPSSSRCERYESWQSCNYIVVTAVGPGKTFAPVFDECRGLCGRKDVRSCAGHLDLGASSLA